MAQPAVDQFFEMQQRALESRQQREEAAEDLVRRIQEAREDLNTRSTHLAALSDELRTMARRSLDEGSNGYIMFANAHLRLAGAFTQGLRRTVGSTDRVLKRSQTDKEEAARREEATRQRRESRDHRKAVNKLTLPTDDAFEELYGEFVGPEVNDA